MRITADTNLLVRVLVRDDARQARLAEAELAGADRVALSLPALCELVWVLVRGYRIAPARVATEIRRLVSAANIATDRTLVEAGLAQLEAGGDFADGVIAHDGARLGGEVFVSFDQAAIGLIRGRGGEARPPRASPSPAP